MISTAFLLFVSAVSSVDECRAALKAFHSKRVVVVGDVMLDRTRIVRDTKKISPESATAPDYLLVSETEYPGGAANVAVNIKNMGGEVSLSAVTGRDRNSRILSSLIEAHGLIPRFSNSFLFEDDARTTTTKERLLLENGTHLHRVSHEDSSHISAKFENEVIQRVAIKKPHIVVISDYAKGVVTPRVSEEIIASSQKLRIPVIVDPKGKDHSKYRGASLVKPNEKEFRLVVGELDSMEEWKQKLAAYRAHLDLDHVIVTRGSEPTFAMGRDGQLIVGPSQKTKVVDVTGAGDTTTAVFALAYGAPISVLLELASKASSIKVQNLGTYAPHLEELKRSLR